MKRLNMLVFIVHGLGWSAIALLPRHQHWFTALAGFVAGASSAFALATYLEIRRDKGEAGGGANG